MEQMQAIHPQLAYFFTSPATFFATACKDFASKGRLYVYPWQSGFDTAFRGKCKVIPYGLTNKVVPIDAIPPVNKSRIITEQRWDRYEKELIPQQYADTSARTRELLLSIADQLTSVGLYYEENKQEKWAVAVYQKAIAISPDEVSALLSEAIIVYNQKNSDEAIGLLEHAVRRNPATPMVYKNIGVMYLRDNNHAKAYENFKKYVAFSPVDNDVSIINNFIASYENNNFGK